MTNFSQKDARWANLKINGTNSTMASYGCYITSLSMLADVTPDQALKMLEKGGGLSGDLVVSKRAAEIMGLDYIESDSRLTSPQPLKLPCIAEVDFSPAEGKQTHFVVYLGNNVIIDSFDGKEKKNPYKVTNYRNIFPKGLIANEKLLETKDRKIEELEEVVQLLRDNYTKRENDFAEFVAPMTQNAINSRVKSFFWRMGSLLAVTASAEVTKFLTDHETFTTGDLKMFGLGLLVLLGGEATKYLNNNYKKEVLEDKTAN